MQCLHALHPDHAHKAAVQRARGASPVDDVVCLHAPLLHLVVPVKCPIQPAPPLTGCDEAAEGDGVRAALVVALASRNHVGEGLLRLLPAPCRAAGRYERRVVDEVGLRSRQRSSALMENAAQRWSDLRL